MPLISNSTAIISMIAIIMGVSGSGKSTIGEGLAEATGGEFFDGDDFHPQANIEKMHAGHPLTDEDRLPWLERLRQLIEDQEVKGKPTFIACSALKKSYRLILEGDGDPAVKFVFLEGSFALIKERLDTRKGHFMPESLLQSQFDALQAPEDAITADISQTPDAIIKELGAKLGLA
ncbi:gluconokinase [Rubellicoccus peritrichatus]|uniref:Gluconokinase n=1 Tax=Rubellicoccus peritrichatus TaxID=3080537 RepID=A0AAQ3L9L3_9BACT|nr:gluconokinase [Puniceicoccus sp. CR14]WOO41631.1 gluconokinase [Puniceicoccus sp. CR14]